MKDKFFTFAAITTILIFTASLATGASSSRFSASAEEIYLPSWTKNIAKWWANGEIGDSDFLQAIQYLLEKGIMKIPATEVSSSYSEIPLWVKIDARLWSSGNIGETSFVQGIQYLIQNGFIKIPKTLQSQYHSISPLENPTVWFAPSPETMGNQYVDSKNFTAIPGQQFIGSRDFMELFDPTAPWMKAEQHVQVFKLYQNWVLTVTDLKLEQTVTYLNNHNITIAMESGALEYSPTCGQAVEGFGGKKPTLDALNRIEEAGGTVHFIALDEPFFFGSYYDGPNACHYSALQVAEKVNAYVKSINLFFPNVVIGDIEPVGFHGAAVIQYKNWLNMYSAVAGSNFPFFDLDTDWSQPNWSMVDKELETFAHDHKIKVGIIYYGNYYDTSDEEWIAHAEDRMVTYEAKAGGRPDNVIFQSWQDHPYYLMPDNDPTTFTHLILSYFKTRTNLNILSSQSSGDLQLNGNLTQVDGKPITDALIQLFTGAISESGIFTESDTTPIDTTQTDKNGTFYFDLKGIKSDTVLQVKYAGDEDHWPTYLEIQNH